MLQSRKLAKWAKVCISGRLISRAKPWAHSVNAVRPETQKKKESKKKYFGWPNRKFATRNQHQVKKRDEMS